MSTIQKLRDSSNLVTKLFKHDLSVYDLKVDETHDTIAVTALYSYDLSKVFDVKASTFRIALPHDRVKEKLDEFIHQVFIGIEHDLISKFPHLKAQRPVTFLKLKELGLIEEVLEFERLLDEELKTNTLNVAIRVRLKQMAEEVSGQFQYDVSLTNETTNFSEKILLKTEMVPFQTSDEAEMYAKRFLKTCQGV